jgi:hypothetical protein
VLENSSSAVADDAPATMSLVFENEVGLPSSQASESQRSGQPLA